MAATRFRSEIQCPICLSAQTKAVGTLAYWRSSPTVIRRCEGCGSHWRETSAVRDPEGYFGTASYTQDNREASLRQARAAMFRFVVAEAGPANLVLDLGASYGHLTEAFIARGAHCGAVEPVERLRRRLCRTGQKTFASVNEIPPDRQYDVIAAIDSLYYFVEPRHAIFTLSKHLRKGGRLILRVTNRTPFLRAAAILGRPITGRLFGDQEVAFSARGLARLLEEAELSIKHRYVWEHKKLSGWQQRLGYPLLAVATKITGADLTPGLFWLAVRR